MNFIQKFISKDAQNRVDLYQKTYLLEGPSPISVLQRPSQKAKKKTHAEYILKPAVVKNGAIQNSNTQGKNQNKQSDHSKDPNLVQISNSLNARER